MRTIILLNAKGGSGKTTLATNIAAYYAAQGKSVVLADFDPQGSSLDWLRARPEDRPSIRGESAWQSTLQVQPDTDYVVIDAPSGCHGTRLVALLRHAQTAIIPVLPSPLDIRAARDFIDEVRRVGRIGKHDLAASGIGRPLAFLRTLFAAAMATRVAVVANRVRENTLAYEALYEFLDRLKIPFLTSLRDTQNYIQAAERGLGVFELAPSQAEHDTEQWQPVFKWLNSKRSLPA